MEFELERECAQSIILYPVPNRSKCPLSKLLWSPISVGNEHKIISHILQEEFPAAEKIYSSDRTMHIFGIDEVREEPGTPTMEDDEEKQQLRHRIRELEETVRTLENCIRELEQHVHTTSPSVITTQAD